jgi:hypothetical protein
MLSDSSSLKEGGKQEPETAAKLDLLEIKDINLAIQSQVCVLEGHEVMGDVVSIIEERSMSQNGQNELAISEKFSEDGFMEQVKESIEFDEAIRRVGGFGAYQFLLFWALGPLAA